jgi:heme exporter protein A
MLFSTLSRPTSGAVRFGNSTTGADAKVRGKIGLLSHSAMTYGELSAKENLLFFARLYGLNNPLERALSLLKRFDLLASMERPVNTFSRGMLQRLGLARALIGEPKLLLLDEPFTGLDSDSTNTVVDVVDEHRSSGGIALMISHDLNVASKLGDEFVVLKRGKQIAHLKEKMAPTALRETYAEVTS